LSASLPVLRTIIRVPGGSRVEVLSPQSYWPHFESGSFPCSFHPGTPSTSNASERAMAQMRAKTHNLWSLEDEGAWDDSRNIGAYLASSHLCYHKEFLESTNLQQSGRTLDKTPILRQRACCLHFVEVDTCQATQTVYPRQSPSQATSSGAKLFRVRKLERHSKDG
jgi:hypothetical protein